MDADGRGGSRRRVLRERSPAAPRSRRAGSSVWRQDPWSAGTGAVLLLNAAIDPRLAARASRCGEDPARSRKRSPTRRVRPAPRFASGADVSRIVVNDGTAVGVLLADGSEVQADAVISNADPEADASSARRSRGAGARIPDEDSQLPLPWHGREGQPGARRAADVPGNDRSRSPRTPSDRSVDRLSRARLRSFQVRRDARPSPTSKSPCPRSSIPRSRRRDDT